MASLSSLIGTPGSGSVNQQAPFTFKSSSAVGADYGARPTVAALQNPTLHNNVPEPMVNSTARVPLFARPFTRGYEKTYSEGDILFVQRDDERSAPSANHGSHNVVANIPVLNYMLRTQTTPDGNALKFQTMEDIKQHWNYFGILNNDMDTGSKWQRLLNINVRGRSRVARMWEPTVGRLKRGDVLWLGFVQRTTSTIESFNNPEGMREPVAGGKTFFECVPTMDCCPEFQTAQYLIPVGMVSQVTLKNPHRSLLNDAKYITEKCKLLERIEVLMRI